MTDDDRISLQELLLNRMHHPYRTYLPQHHKNIYSGLHAIRWFVSMWSGNFVLLQRMHQFCSKVAMYELTFLRSTENNVPVLFESNAIYDSPHAMIELSQTFSYVWPWDPYIHLRLVQFSPSVLACTTVWDCCGGVLLGAGKSNMFLS